MAFRLQDLCKTTRRSTGHGLPRLFPRMLGDDRLDPRLHIAIRFFETNLGQPRRALDAEALVALFGDPRLARGLVRCLARTYSYCPRPLTDVLGTARATALAARGLATPRDLRTLAYERANQDGGFVAPEQRTDFLADLLEEEDLGANDLERALWLDAPDQAVLVRGGPVPTVADLRTCYNVQVLETVLGASPESHFALCGDRALVEAVAARYAVRVMPSRDECLAGLLADHLEPNGVSNTGNALPEWLETLINATRSAGSLTESDLAQRLGCAAEEVQSHLAAMADTAGDVVYIDGFGLCTASLLARARTLVDEETADHAGQLELTRLGRRLREVVGHNEGLHALIATISGALVFQPSREAVQASARSG